MHRLIIDNGGGATLQLGDWAHCYDGRAEQCAEDIGTWLDTQSTDGWDGHDDDAAELDPTPDELRNGGYRIVQLDTREQIVADLRRLGGATESQLADKLNVAAGESLASQNLIRFEARVFDTPTALEDFAESLGAEISQDWEAGTTTVLFSDGSKLVNEGPDWSVTI